MLMHSKDCFLTETLGLGINECRDLVKHLQFRSQPKEKKEVFGLKIAGSANAR